MCMWKHTDKFCYHFVSYFVPIQYSSWFVSFFIDIIIAQIIFHNVPYVILHILMLYVAYHIFFYGVLWTQFSLSSISYVLFCPTCYNENNNYHNVMAPNILLNVFAILYLIPYIPWMLLLCLLILFHIK